MQISPSQKLSTNIKLLEKIIENEKLISRKFQNIVYLSKKYLASCEERVRGEGGKEWLRILI